MTKIEYVSFQDKINPSDWRVEAINETEGDVFITLFAGPAAEERSVEYAAFKNGTHPIFKKVVAATAPPMPAAPEHVPGKVYSTNPTSIPSTDRFELKTDNGHELTVTLSEVKWNYDARRKVLTGRPRPAIEIQKGFSPKG